MTQQELGVNLTTRRPREAVFLDEMNLVVPWMELLSLGRCNPFHLSDNPDQPDSPAVPTARLGGSAGSAVSLPGKVAPLLLPGDAFARLVGYLMLLGQRPVR